MSLTFLSPLFLAGLAALAVPVVVHLTRQARRNAVPFPSLMFLRRVPHRTERRQRIRHWLLFVLRCAAVVLLALAFARPVMRGTTASPAGGGARDVVVLLDRSASMGYADRWERARGAVEDAVDGLRPDDRFSLVAFADGAEAAVRRSADAEEIRRALSALDVGDGATRYGPALQLAAQILEGSDRPRREIMLVTDFQRSGWDPRDVARLPPGTVVTPVPLADGPGENLTVVDLLVERGVRDGRPTVEAAARLVNTGPDPRGEVEVRLELDGQGVGVIRTRVQGQGAETVRFAPAPVPRRTVLGTVVLEDDPLPRDNRFHFVLPPRRAVPVLLVDRGGAGSRAGLYLRRALEVSRDPAFEVVVRRPGALAPADLQARPAVILNDVGVPGGRPDRLLADYVVSGGRVLVVLAETPPADRGALGAFLPGVEAAAVDRLNEGGGALAVATYDHPIFEPFKESGRGDFSRARIFRYRRMRAGNSAEVLLRFDGGTPALVERAVGSGRLLTLATGLANRWNDLPLQPVFVPLVHLLARYLAGYEPPRSWVRVGETVDLANALGGGGAAPRELVIEYPSGRRAVHTWSGETGRYVAFDEAGFVRVRPVEARPGDGAVVAVNVDPDESDLHPADVEEVVSAIARPAADTAGVAAAGAGAPSGNGGGPVALWRYLLVALAVIVIVETVVANRTRPAGAPDRARRSEP